MSSYTNFIKDFPTRCLDILTTYEKHARLKDHEVTLMLSIAATGFVIPFERLRRPSPENPDHPSRDRERFSEAMDELEKILDDSFLGSVLWKKKDSSSWVFARKLEDVQKEPDFWPELENPKFLSKQKKVSSVLKHLRNALTHGNIFSRGNPIQLIIFLSRCCEYVDEQCEHTMFCPNCGNKILCTHMNKKCVPTDKYDLLGVSPQDFREFLMNWLAFVSSLPISSGVKQESVIELLEYSM